jgi:hypothetical protein
MTDSTLRLPGMQQATCSTLSCRQVQTTWCRRARHVAYARGQSSMAQRSGTSAVDLLLKF